MDALQGQDPAAEGLQPNMDRNSNNAVIVFQKNLILGKVKTRLAKTIGNEAALDIYRSLINITYSELSQLKDVDILVYLSDYVEELPFDIKGKNYKIFAQKGSDLGDRMKNAFEETLANGYQKCVIIGTDCPDLSMKEIQQAIDHLATHDVVFGPAEDGGYYLLGKKEILPFLMQNINWSTSEVLATSIERLKNEKLSYKLLEKLGDIDTEKDWKNYKLRKANEQLP
ncbi:TIGR04282 family arsenosugar biosynthesis glycosyltransferase [Mongoliibacter ruber]|uniref:Glycosyltransferase A (GT-A) superfamily protein (DUF2064 family) n=1 Tax=Mongoliibacter ruber TaxID=1750599 RepID=A0A2T0WKH4_9BACT|nr:TIGR04282 family arsenosugar biosynthesis glycosyltransferase [Mongoliibacter ruber]PRY87208.1 hypothetical protein CLW00_107278 [Mongoliibacter ruber]